MKHGDYIPLYWEDHDDDTPEFIRGHVTAEQALPTLQFETSNEWPAVKVRHVWARFVFSSDRDIADRELHTYDAPSRGAWAVTECKRAEGGAE